MCIFILLFFVSSCLLFPVSVKSQGLMTVKFAPEIILIAREDLCVGNNNDRNLSTSISVSCSLILVLDSFNNILHFPVYLE